MGGRNMPKEKSRRFFLNDGVQVAQYDPNLLELENILLEIGEIVGIESPLDCEHMITYLCKNGYTNEHELIRMKIDF